MKPSWTLLIGDFSGAEFAPAATAVAASGKSHRVGGLSEAVELLRQSPTAPTLMILAAPAPGAFSQRDVQRLRRAAPLARLIAVLGSWCEGERRSGQAIPGVIRTMWHEFVPRWADEIESQPSRLRAWGLPETAADEERLLLTASMPGPGRIGLIAIVSRNQDAAELYGATCRSCGYATAWLTTADDVMRISSPAAVLWDGDVERLEELAKIRRRSAAPIIAFMDFPRADDVRRATESGAAAVFGRPLLLDSLLRCLDKLATPPASEHAA